MFVITEDYEILNLAQCIKIVVVRNEIDAYTAVSGSPRSRNRLASFDTEVEAGYAYFELFKALKAGKRTWDPDTLKPLSTLWDKIDKHFDNTDVPYGLIGDAEIIAFNLDTVTIKCGSQAQSLRENTLIGFQKRIAKKLKEILGDKFIEVEWTF